ncbi:hypothetical protein AUJ63_01755 [Candidatus Pacearchaeota archaeon CG1_02_35_32]|nr:MAG: hypothetical protein AUJ63_01755 [Candidatus Pacearchaeota archaeon CG1_02_35_32]
MFYPQLYDDGKLVKIPLAVSQTIVKGDALVWAGGYLAAAGATSEDIRYVAMEAVTTSDVQHTECLVLPVMEVRFEADCDGVVSIVDRGTYADLANKAQINPDATLEKVFMIEEIVGKEEVSKTVRGYFVRFTAT